MSRDEFMQVARELYEGIPEETPEPNDADYNTIRLAVMLSGLVVFNHKEKLISELESLLWDFGSRHRAEIEHFPEDN